MFVSLFMVMKFFFYANYIVGGAVIAWLPQILHNIFNRNRLCLPYLSIIALSLNKIVMPFYFRANEDNMFQIKKKAESVYLACAVLLVEAVVLILQSAIDPLFFLPDRFKPKEDGCSIFLTENEIKTALGTRFEQMDCVICIHPLAPTAGKLYTEDDFLDLNQERRCGLRKVVKLFSNCRNFIDFHRIEIKRAKKNYMATSCMHYFHTDCLESWIKVKKECPFCRKEIKNM